MRFEKFPTWPQWEAASTSFMEKLTAKPALARFNPTFARANKAKLLEIDDMVKRYHIVLDMSKLNLLMRIREAIIEWAADKIERGANTGRLQAMQALLDVTLRTIDELDGWARHRYVKVACIGYEVGTGGYQQDWSPKNDARRFKIDEADAKRGCDNLVSAIQAAQKTYQTYIDTQGIALDDDRKTLKIFMAPEFFFRGRYGAFQDIGLCSTILETMRNEIREGKYADWLFVHGTALFTSERDPVEGGGSYLENYALVQKGGAPDKTSDLVVAKEFPSHVDFKHPTVSDLGWFDPATSQARVAGKDVKHISPVGGRLDPVNVPTFDGVNYGRAKDLAEGGSVKVSELVGGVLFTMDNLTFGLEVCRDHLVGRLAHCAEAGRAMIQLIPSCGVPNISADGLGCKSKGIVFNVDGGGGGHCEIQVRDAQPKDWPTNVYGALHKPGVIRIYSAAKIPWSKAPNRVAQRLDISSDVLSGEKPLERRA